MKPRVLTICQIWLVALASLLMECANSAKPIEEERATYDQTGHPSMAWSVSPETAFTSAELTHSTWELADLAS